MTTYLRSTCLALAILAAPVASAQEADPSQELADQLGEILRGLRETIEPALENLIDQFSVLEEIDSFENYEKPEVLPNGDIIIRRSPDAPEYTPPQEQTPEEGGVDT